jgi:hypothetical protein
VWQGLISLIKLTNYFIPVGLSPMEIKKEQKGLSVKQLVAYEEYSVLVLSFGKSQENDEITMIK